MQITSRLGKVVQLDGILLAILIGSLGINVYLSVSRARAAAPVTSRPEPLAVGVKAPDFEGITATGKTVRLDYSSDHNKTLLYVFSPTCHWCERNLDNIRAIIKSRSDLRVVGVNIGPALSPEQAAKQPFSQVLRPSPATAVKFHLSGTPTTLLIAPDGKLLNNWSGAYAGSIATDVKRVLAVELPGLSDES